MTNFLIDKFILKEGLSDKNQRQRYAVGASFIGIFCNIFLSLIKIFCGIYFDLISVFGDGINNLSDALSSIVIFFGFRISEKPADKNHPFGHARMEYISALIVSFLIIFVGFELCYSSFKKIFNEEISEFSSIIPIILIFSIIVKFWLYKFNEKISIIIKSKAIEATAKDSLNDVFVTFSVLITTIIYQKFNVNLDAYAGIILGIVIVKSAIDLAKDTLDPLLGEAPDEEIIEFIIKKLNNYEEILGFHDIIVHTYGFSRNFVSVHIEMDVNFGFMESHEVADAIEREFLLENINLVVHIDPVVTNCKKCDDYKSHILKIIEKIDEKLTIHDFRAVFNDYQTKLVFDIVLVDSIKISSEKLKNYIKDEMMKIDENCELIINVDMNYDKV